MESFSGGMWKSLSCYLFVLFLFLWIPEVGGVLSQYIVRVWKGAKFRARVFPMIFMNADKSHIFRAVSEKKLEMGQRGSDVLL